MGRGKECNLKRSCLERTLLGNGCRFLEAIPLQVKVEAKTDIQHSSAINKQLFKYW